MASVGISTFQAPFIGFITSERKKKRKKGKEQNSTNHTDTEYMQSLILFCEQEGNDFTEPFHQ